jgi:hypothetical protein
MLIESEHSMAREERDGSGMRMESMVLPRFARMAIGAELFPLKGDTAHPVGVLISG